MKMKKIAVLTSGGDSPGMNAAIRAVVRTGIFYNLEVFAVERGFAGLMEGQIFPMNQVSVGGIMQRGGTVLKTSRSEKFKTKEGLDIALQNAIDKIKDTASSHQRAFVVEVMGRNSGYLALMSGIAGGVEVILVPEIPYNLPEISLKLKEGYQRGKTHCIIVIAEGVGKTDKVRNYLEDKIGYETRITILGYLQRGGSPSAFDRILASRLGAAAVEHLLKGETSKMVGLIANKVEANDLEIVLSQQKTIKQNLYDLASVLAK
jgi:6-phosphofructokinase 1